MFIIRLSYYCAQNMLVLVITLLMGIVLNPDTWTTVHLAPAFFANMLLHVLRGVNSFHALTAGADGPQRLLAADVAG